MGGWLTAESRRLERESVQEMTNLECYGQYSSLREKCKTCKYTKYCKETTFESEADACPNYDELKKLQIEPLPLTETQSRLFTYNEVLGLLRWFTTLTPGVLRALADAFKAGTLREGSVTWAAKRLRISKQALSKTIKRGVKKHPEIAKCFYRREENKK